MPEAGGNASPYVRRAPRVPGAVFLLCPPGFSCGERRRRFTEVCVTYISTFS